MITGEVPRPRYYHASTVIQNDQLVVFAGRTKMQNAIESIYILKPAENKIILNIEEENDDEWTLSFMYKLPDCNYSLFNSFKACLRRKTQ